MAGSWQILDSRHAIFPAQPIVSLRFRAAHLSTTAASPAPHAALWLRAQAARRSKMGSSNSSPSRGAGSLRAANDPTESVAQKRSSRLTGPHTRSQRSMRTDSETSDQVLAELSEQMERVQRSNSFRKGAQVFNRPIVAGQQPNGKTPRTSAATRIPPPPVTSVQSDDWEEARPTGDGTRPTSNTLVVEELRLENIYQEETDAAKAAKKSDASADKKAQRESKRASRIGLLANKSEARPAPRPPASEVDRMPGDRRSVRLPLDQKRWKSGPGRTETVDVAGAEAERTLLTPPGSTPRRRSSGRRISFTEDDYKSEPMKANLEGARSNSLQSTQSSPVVTMTAAPKTRSRSNSPLQIAVMHERYEKALPRHSLIMNGDRVLRRSLVELDSPTGSPVNALGFFDGPSNSEAAAMAEGEEPEALVIRRRSLVMQRERVEDIPEEASSKHSSLKAVLQPQNNDVEISPVGDFAFDLDDNPEIRDALVRSRDRQRSRPNSEATDKSDDVQRKDVADTNNNSSSSNNNSSNSNSNNNNNSNSNSAFAAAAAIAAAAAAGCPGEAPQKAEMEMFSRSRQSSTGTVRPSEDFKTLALHPEMPLMLEPRRPTVDENDDETPYWAGQGMVGAYSNSSMRILITDDDENVASGRSGSPEPKQMMLPPDVWNYPRSTRSLNLSRARVQSAPQRRRASAESSTTAIRDSSSFSSHKVTLDEAIEQGLEQARKAGRLVSIESVIDDAMQREDVILPNSMVQDKSKSSTQMFDESFVEVLSQERSLSTLSVSFDGDDGEDSQEHMSLKSFTYRPPKPWLHHPYASQVHIQKNSAQNDILTLNQKLGMTVPKVRMGKQLSTREDSVRSELARDYSFYKTMSRKRGSTVPVSQSKQDVFI
eukprot:scaffold869_cov303-Pinguiococcus_pyrenoidosus.AAC.22